MIEELITRIFATRNAAHLEHWRTKSFSALYKLTKLS